MSEMSRATYISIRKASAGDLAEVHALIMEFATFLGRPEKVYTTPGQMLDDRDHFQCLVALSGDRIIGFASYFTAYYSWSGKAMYLDDLYVQETFRGQGIGKLLLNEVIAMARKNDCKKVKWQVSNWNQKAIGFYQSLGAEIDEVEINCDLSLNKPVS